MGSFHIAVVGATGAVGAEMVKILSERGFPISRLRAVASARSAGREVDFGGQQVLVESLENFDFDGVDIVLFSAGGDVAGQYAPAAAAAGCAVIDNSSCFRYEDDIPLVVPEVNPEKIADFRARGIIANPNCSTIQMVVALKPLHDAAGILRVEVATYQSVSGAGASGIEELAQQSRARLCGESHAPEKFPAPIAFNALPHIDVFQENGYTREEMKMVWETQKILGDDSLEINPTAVRIPVFYAHSEAVHLQLREPLSAAAARKILKNAPGVQVVDERAPGGYPTATEHAAGEDAVFVGRIREDISRPCGLNLWIVSDNVRKGAALNAVQIAEHLAADYL